MISEKLRNYDAANQKHKVEADVIPTELDDLPVYDQTSSLQQQEPPIDTERNESNDESQPGRDSPRMDDGDADTCLEPKMQRSARAAEPVAILCGEIPEGFTVDLFHAAPVRNNNEGRYCQRFATKMRNCLPSPKEQSPHPATPHSCGIDSAEAAEAAVHQQNFFKAVDKFQVEPTGPFHENPKPNSFDTRLHEAVASLPSGNKRTPTVVMEAAFSLLKLGLLNVPDVGTINVKQARAFLWNAAWLQEHMNEKWREEGVFLEDCPKAPRIQQFALAIVGPGGIGKTAVLKVVEALTTFFAGHDTVRKMAPSNAAARLLHGDTLHALLKLPFGNTCLSQKKGRLSQDALTTHRKKWRSVIAAYIDEVSMIPANQFLQCDVPSQNAGRSEIR